MDTERELAGKALYESRLKNLHGLLMPDAPRWDELPAEVRERWCSYADAGQ
ncbi:MULTISPECIES: hypothetical protein [Glutamicibacter]|uniref:Uncharacterized protein n=1 Tax=Glutamicibacter ardleyensis TaxID=225894 RepID=A0ABQ2DE59_9MICC|nr:MULTISPECIES: hypothetical protein [Glutamicibacter]GGJ52589.1 hypothetical protein GCM10007173_09030 [Glutamicibacter ardleyensis]